MTKVARDAIFQSDPVSIRMIKVTCHQRNPVPAEQHMVRTVDEASCSVSLAFAHVPKACARASKSNQSQI